MKPTKKGVPHTPAKARRNTPPRDVLKKQRATPIDAGTAAALLDLVQGKKSGGEDTAVQQARALARQFSHRDPRDPYGRIEQQMLDAHTRVYELQQPGLWQHDLSKQWKREHPEFAQEYEDELQRRETEATSGHPRSGKADPHGGTAERTDEAGQAPAPAGNPSGQPKEKSEPRAPEIDYEAGRETARALERAVTGERGVLPRTIPRIIP